MIVQAAPRSGRLSQHDEATASTAKIIPLRPWFDPPPSRDEDPPVKFAHESPAQARTAEPPSAVPFLREVPKAQARTEARIEAKAEAKIEAKTEAKTEVKTEARTEAKTEAKTPPGSTVVIEQAVPAPPLQRGR